jgi:hypothetical protein
MKVRTIEELCLESLLRSSGDVSSKSEFTRLINEFKLSQKKINMIRIKAYTEMGQLNAVKDFVLAMNKRNEIIPYEIIFEYLDSVNRQNVYLYYSSIRSI